MPTNNLLSPPLPQESIFCSLLALSTLNNSVELYCKESRTYFYRIHNESKTATIKQLAGEILLLYDQLGNLPNLYTTQYLKKLEKVDLKLMKNYLDKFHYFYSLKKNESLNAENFKQINSNALEALVIIYNT